MEENREQFEWKNCIKFVNQIESKEDILLFKSFEDGEMAVNEIKKSSCCYIFGRGFIRRLKRLCLSVPRSYQKV